MASFTIDSETIFNILKTLDVSGVFFIATFYIYNLY